MALGTYKSIEEVAKKRQIAILSALFAALHDVFERAKQQAQQS